MPLFGGIAPILPALLQYAQRDPGFVTILPVLLGLLAIMVLFAVVFAARYRKVGPNKVMIVSGGFGATVTDERKRKLRIGFRWVKGGGVFVWPVLERADYLSLELMTVEVETPDVLTAAGETVQIRAVAQVKIGGDDSSIVRAAERFLSKSPEEIGEIAAEMLDSRLRAVIRKSTMEEINRDRDVFAERVEDEVAPEFGDMGLGIESFNVKDVRSREA